MNKHDRKEVGTEIILKNSLSTTAIGIVGSASRGTDIVLLSGVWLKMALELFELYDVDVDSKAVKILVIEVIKNLSSYLAVAQISTTISNLILPAFGFGAAGLHSFIGVVYTRKFGNAMLDILIETDGNIDIYDKSIVNMITKRIVTLPNSKELLNVK